MKSKHLSLGLGLVLSFSLVACGSQQATQEPPKEPDQSVQQSETVTQPIETKQEEQAEPTPLAEVDKVGTPAETAPADGAEPAEPVEVQLFTEVNETVYATGAVNLRASWSADSEKLGSLGAGESVTRLGTGIAGTEAEGWSRVALADGSIAYMSNQYLSTTKPVQQSQPTQVGNQGQQQPQQTESSDDGLSGGLGLGDGADLDALMQQQNQRPAAPKQDDEWADESVFKDIGKLTPEQLQEAYDQFAEGNYTW